MLEMEGQLPTHDENLLLKSASERTINELVEINRRFHRLHCSQLIRRNESQKNQE